jgi:hypothetical protein
VQSEQHADCVRMMRDAFDGSISGPAPERAEDIVGIRTHPAPFQWMTRARPSIGAFSAYADSAATAAR